MLGGDGGSDGDRVDLWYTAGADGVGSDPEKNPDTSM